jgi:hypothetical protein
MASKLEEWYLQRCDGEWEHSYGIKIDTLDNPGWTIKIDLKETKQQDAILKRVAIHRTEHDWIEYWVDYKQFNIACGPKNFSEATEIFVEWFDSVET